MLKNIILWIQLRLQPGSAQQVQNALNQATNATQAVQNVGALNTAFGGLGRLIDQIGKKLLLYFGGRAIFRFFEDSIMLFARFDQKLQQSIAILDNVDARMRKMMGETAKQLAVELNIPAEQLAEGYYFLASAGLSADQALKALPITALFAKAGMLDMAKATELLTQSVAALGYSSKDSTVQMAGMVRFADIISLAAAKSQATIAELATSFTNKAGNSLRLFNKDVEEGAAVLAVFANQGVKGAVAGERLDMFMRQATQAAVKHAKVFEQYGIRIFDDAGKMRSFADIADDLTKALGHLSDEQQVIALQQLGFQVRSVFAVKAFIGQADAIREYERELRSASGYTKQVAEKELDTPIERWGQFQKKIENVRMEIGEAFIPTLIHLGETLGDENNPDSIIAQLKAFAIYLDKNPQIIEGLGAAINWLVAKPLKFLWRAFDDVTDLAIILGGSALFLVAEAFNLISIASYMALKAVGSFINLISGGYFHELDDFAEMLHKVQDHINDFANGTAKTVGNAVNSLIHKDLQDWMDETNPEPGKNSYRRKRLIDDISSTGAARQNTPKKDGRAPNIESDEERKKREKFEAEVERERQKRIAAEAEEQERRYEARMKKIRRIGEHTADALADAFSMFYSVITEGSGRTVDAFEAMGRAMVSAMVLPMSEYFMLKARENFILSAEAIAMAFKAAGNPFTVGLVAPLLEAAERHAAVGAMWAALGGVSGSVGSGLVGHAHGMNRTDNASEQRTDDSRRQGPDIHIHIDGIDPKNARHQKLVGDTIEEWAERTGGTIIID
jgi:TP901 family phage tail tape measure protein